MRVEAFLPPSLIDVVPIVALDDRSMGNWQVAARHGGCCVSTGKRLTKTLARG